MRFLRLVSCLLPPASCLLLVGCGPQRPTPNAQPPTPNPQRLTPNALFEDVAQKAGITFRHDSGAAGKYRFIENTAAGCAFFDYDQDGLLDVFLVQSGPSEPPPLGKARPFCALYHNTGNGTFTDVTAGSGFDRDLGFGQGVAIGDYDNDGKPDLFLTAFGGNHLFRNETPSFKEAPNAKPRFREVTAEMGLAKVHSTGYATSAAFGDYDNDGKLDLYVCYYTPWTWEKDIPCKDAHGQQDYCAPDLYDPESHRLYHNTGGKFADVSEQAGITKKRGRGLAVAFFDYNNDGKQDIFVGNDMNSTMLWRNNGNGTFTEVALEAGCAYSEVGTVMNAMGIGVADYDHSGYESLFVTNFSDKPNILYKNRGNGFFEDQSMASGLALPHLPYLAWGCEFIDYDADGWRDLIVANGHVQAHIDKRGAGVTYQERKQLFHNEQKGTFREITDPGEQGELALPTVSRGLASGDFDNDGRLDFLVSNQNSPVQLFRNRDQSPRHWASFRLVGVKSNREGVHARLTLTAGGMTQVATVRGGSSYLSSSDRRVYFGLGDASKIKKLVVHWPSGQQDVVKGIAGDAFFTLKEGQGVVETRRVPH